MIGCLSEAVQWKFTRKACTRVPRGHVKVWRLINPHLIYPNPMTTADWLVRFSIIRGYVRTDLIQRTRSSFQPKEP